MEPSSITSEIERGTANNGDNHQNDEELRTPLLSSTTAISTSPYTRRDVVKRSAFLTNKQIETKQLEDHAHQIPPTNIILLFILNTYSHIKIYVTMLIRLESIVGALLTVGATLVAYYYYPRDDVEWNGNLPSVLLSFAVITPLGQSITMGFTRREQALKSLASYRSAVYNLYVAHSSWDWGSCNKNEGRRGCVENVNDEISVYGTIATGGDDVNSSKITKSIDFINHSETVLCHLINLSDSLYSYLTLPDSSRARHRVTKSGIEEASTILTCGRVIFTNNIYGRMIMISQLCEALKYRGMPSNEASRIRQWENQATTAVEELRVVKEYRTLQVLRVFGRLCSLFLPPFYATTYVQVAIETNSLALGLALGIITSLALTCLFECVRQIEDPFVSHITLDGIDVREELIVLAYQELMVARKILFPNAEEYEVKSDDCLQSDVIHNEKRADRVRDTTDRESRYSVSKVGVSNNKLK